VIKADTGFRSLSPISKASNITNTGANANTFPPNTQDGLFNNLIVGVGNYVFKVTEEGMWLGDEDFDDAPFKVSMGGEVTIGGYLSDAYLLEGEAASDINSHTTTISGGKITTGTIEADQMAANAIVARAIASDAILVRHIKAREITANKIALNTLTADEIESHTITAEEIETGTFVVTGGAAGDINSGTTTVNGGKITTNTITAKQIDVGAVDTDQLAANAVKASKIDVTSLSAITATLGSVSSGTITGSVIVVPNESGGSAGYLRWSSGSRIWSDSSGNMGYRAVGGYQYFYGPSGTTIARLRSGGQSTFYTGIICSGVLTTGSYASIAGSITAGGNVTASGRFHLGAESTSWPFITYRSSTTMALKGHVDAYYQATYNLGGSTYYWLYVNCYRVSEHSMTSFDSPVEMRDGRKLDDIGALKAIKEDTIIDKTTGRPFLDKRTFPKDVLVPAYDQKTGKPYKRDKNDRPLVPNEEGKLEPRPDADGIATGQMLSLLYGGFKQLVDRVEELEKKSSKNVKI
jgi:hypothetical protein